MVQSENMPVEIPAPASKSLSHRYFIGAALANGTSTLHHTLESADLEATREILRAAGASMAPIKGQDGAVTGWHVTGMNGQPRGGSDSPLQCDVHESGTTCRLLAAVLAAGVGLFRIFGEGRISERPVGALCDILKSLGCGIVYEGKQGCPPILMQANGLNPNLVDGYVHVNMDESSQYLSGLLFAAPMAKSPLCLEVGGAKPVSWPYVGLTLQCLTDFGIRFQVERRPRIGTPWIPLQEATWRSLQDIRPGCLRIRVWPGEYKPGNYTIEGDWSGASYFLAAGAIGKHPVRITGLRPNSLQGDSAMIDVLKKMGATVETGTDSVTVLPSQLHGVDLDLGACPDLVPTVAVLAAFAKGSTRISHVGHLRLKECDRIAAPAEELRKAGVTVDALSDGLLINGLGGIAPHFRKGPDAPKLPDNASLCAHNDHRIAMSLALLEMRSPDLHVADRLDDPAVVRKSFPDFWKLWGKLQ